MRKTVLALGVVWAVLISAGLGFAGDTDKDKDLFLGVYVDEVTSKIAEDYGVEVGGGVLVSGTVDGSPADEAGLRANDILLKLDGRKLTGPAELRVQIQTHEPGKKVDLTYKRGGKQKTVAVELVERDSHRKSWFTHEGDCFEWDSDEHHVFVPKLKKFKEAQKSIAFCGIVTQELSEGLETYFKVDDGALISEVVEDSPAEEAGLKAGDVIVEIGGRDISDTGDVTRAIRKHDPGDEVDFVIYREGSKKTIKVTLTSRAEHYGSEDSTIQMFGDNIIFDGNRITVKGDEELAESLSEIMISIDELDLEDLDVDIEEMIEEIEDLDIQIEDIPDVQMDLSIEPGPPTILQMNLDQARAISSDSWWKRSWNEVKERLEADFERLKAQFEQLKVEFEQLKQEFKDRML